MKVRSGRFSGRSFRVETIQRRFNFAFGSGSAINWPASISARAIQRAAMATPMPSFASSMKLFSRYALLHEEFLNQREV